ncbi:hypothetical protein O0L34_g16590 [Tuta absoluta]|nr:hypothetical protein O0L34_g16590 [Tuta absoluta]
MNTGRWLLSLSYVVVLLSQAEGVLEIRGQISFDLLLPEERAQEIISSSHEATEAKDPNVKAKPRAIYGKETDSIKAESSKVVVTEANQKESLNITRAVPVECVYQYPDTAQVDALLSNMMNQLTKLFVRVKEHLRSHPRRLEDDKRFKVVNKISDAFFDSIYLNMTEEYRKYANYTRESVQMKARDNPCEHQAEIREVWRALIDSSNEALRRAALACVEEHLRARAHLDDDAGRSRGRAHLDVDAGESKGRAHLDDAGESKGRARSRASQLLRQELARVRSEQLVLLCERFQLCYSELL